MAGRPIILGVKPYEPDLAAFGTGRSMYVRNVLPRTAASYGPLSGLSAYATSALAARCQGSYAAADTAGNISVFAGTASNLYRMTTSAATFSSVSKSAGAYAAATDQFWNFCTINNRVIACNLADPPQTFTLDSGSAFADLSVDAPKAKYCAGIKNFLMLANTNDGVSGAAPWRAWWSALGAPDTWPTPGSATAAANQSDYNDIVTEGGQVTGLVGNLGTADGALFYQHAVWRIVYVGPPAVFGFFPAEGVRGCQVPGSIVQLGALVYYLGEDGFYVFDGSNSQPIGVDKVDKTFFADLDQAQMFRMIGAADPINKMVFWAYPGVGNTSGNPNRLIIYNWATKTWSIADLDCEYLVRSLSLGYSLDGLDTLGYTMETLPFSLDSQAWTAGRIQLAAFNTTHVYSLFSGTTLAATVDTEELQPFPGQRTFITNARPLVDGGTPTVAIGTRELQTSSATYNAGMAMNSLGWCPQRISGRYSRARITLPAGSSFTHISGVELDCAPVGIR